jgi:uncharacterized membrane protein
VDDGASVAWLPYVPLPGLGLVAVALEPRSRLVRYHAWQGTALVLALLAAMILVGLLSVAVTDKAARGVLGFLAGLLLLAGILQMAWGGVAAALGRYVRLRPAWDLAAALRRDAAA